MAVKINEAARIIDLSPKPVKAQVVREGYQVPAVALDPQKATFAIEQLVPITPRFLPRVISQSIAPGTKVMQNTVVDLIVAPKDVIPFTILDSVHLDLKGKTLDFVDEIVANPKGREVLLKYEKGADVPASDKQFLLTQFASKGIVVDETNPERTFDRAFKSVQATAAFF